MTGRRNSANPPWNQANFGGYLQNFLIFLAPGTPFPNIQWGKEGNAKLPQTEDAPRDAEGRNETRRNAEIGPSIHGIRRILADSSQISQYFWRRTPPLPQHPIREGGEDEITEVERQTAEPRGTLRNVAEHRNFSNPPWNPPHFGGILQNFLIFFAPDTPFPNTQLRKGNAKPPNAKRSTAERHGTRRDA